MGAWQREIKTTVDPKHCLTFPLFDSIKGSCHFLSAGLYKSTCFPFVSVETTHFQLVSRKPKGDHHAPVPKQRPPATGPPECLDERGRAGLGGGRHHKGHAWRSCRTPLSVTLEKKKGFPFLGLGPLQWGHPKKRWKKNWGH